LLTWSGVSWIAGGAVRVEKNFLHQCGDAANESIKHIAQPSTADRPSICIRRGGAEQRRAKQSRTGMQRELRQSGADKVEQDAPTHGRCWRCRDQRKQSNRKAKRGDQMGSAAAARSASPAAAIQTADRWVRSHKTKCSMAWIRHTRAEENGESEERRGGRKDEESHLTHLT
jgi:hypothetical protein